ncbi:MAG: DNA repair protein RadA, partial [Rhodospirillales bacterium 12-54-5]
MSKSSSHYVCQSCGNISRKWTGKCDACGTWDSLVEEAVTAIPKGMKPGKSKGLEVVSLSNAVEAPTRDSMGIAELDRVLGGGLVPGSAILLGGDPG